MELEDLPFQFFREITDGFSEDLKLGEGTFGVVYKVRLGILNFVKKYILNMSSHTCSSLKNNGVIYMWTTNLGCV